MSAVFFVGRVQWNRLCSRWSRFEYDWSFLESVCSGQTADIRSEYFIVSLFFKYFGSFFDMGLSPSPMIVMLIHQKRILPTSSILLLKFPIFIINMKISIQFIKIISITIVIILQLERLPKIKFRLMLEFKLNLLDFKDSFGMYKLTLFLKQIADQMIRWWSSFFEIIL